MKGLGPIVVVGVGVLAVFLAAKAGLFDRLFSPDAHASRPATGQEVGQQKVNQAMGQLFGVRPNGLSRVQDHYKNSASSKPFP